MRSAPVSEAQDAINKMLELRAQWSEHVCVCVVTPPRTVDAVATGTGKELEIQVTMINILQQLVASIIAGATNQTKPN